MLDAVALFFLTHHGTGQTGNAIPLLSKVGVRVSVCVLVCVSACSRDACYQKHNQLYECILHIHIVVVKRSRPS